MLRNKIKSIFSAFIFMSTLSVAFAGTGACYCKEDCKKQGTCKKPACVSAHNKTLHKCPNKVTHHSRQGHCECHDQQQ